MAGASLVAVRLRLGSLPGDLTMGHVLGLAALAKVDILAGSLVSGLAGAALLATGRHPSRRDPAAAAVDAAGAP